MPETSEHPTTEEDSYRPLQFTLRSLLIFTFVACVVLSIGKALGAVLLVLGVIQVILATIIEAGSRINHDQVSRPLLRLATFASFVLFLIASVIAMFLVALIAVSFFWAPA